METKVQLSLFAIMCLLMALWGPKACVQEDKATQLLESQGYTEIKITGWRPFMASDSDSFSTGFEAKSPKGEYVTGAVTAGLFKGSTVRFD